MILVMSESIETLEKSVSESFGLIVGNFGKALLTYATISAITIPGFMGIGNYLDNHNLRREFDRGITVSKIDGLASHTRLMTIDDQVASVNRFSLFGDSKYIKVTDEGKVDTVQIISGIPFLEKKSEVFYRDEHIEQYSEVFAGAQEDVDEQVDRFQDLL